MKKVIIISATILAVGIGGMLFKPRKAACAWCPTWSCSVSSQCGQGCVCGKPFGSFTGKCYSAD